MAAPELTEAQQAVIHNLPASATELSEQLEITESSVKGRIRRIRQAGVDIAYDHASGVYVLVDDAKVRRVSTKHTGTKTREANDFITEVEKTILRRLKSSEPLITPQSPTPGHEDMVLHLSDLHIGDRVENEHGTVVYDSEIAQKVVRHITDKTLSLKEQLQGFAAFDTIHVLYGGDMITNENIYDGQAYDIESQLADQMTTAVDCLTRQLKSFSNAFETVNVVCQPGNHGKTRASGVSKQANMDLVTYRWIDDRLRESNFDNIDFTAGEATWFRTFELRGGKWTGFLTHGQDSLEHIGTSSGRNRWRGWLNEFDFHVGYRGHFHESKREPIQNGPMVFESPSPKPSDEWTSKIGYGDVGTVPKRLATLHGVSDKRPVTWEFVIDDSGM